MPVTDWNIKDFNSGNAVAANNILRRITENEKLIGYFNRDYIKTRRIDRNIGEIFGLAYDRREVAGYHDFVYLTKTQVDEYRLRMAEFIRQADLIIQQKLKDF
ncbi:MAG: hypothetical protein WCK13_12620 [Ignavibacteriota bacterium]